MKKPASVSATRLRLFGPASLLLLVAFAIAFSLIEPAPPGRIRVATGDSQGAYSRFAQQYADYFRQHGIHLELVPTAGSIENLRLLTRGEVDFAFVQGGTRPAGDSNGLQALASLYFEPLWLFHRKNLRIDRLNTLAGLRVSLGTPGSGTYALVSKLIRDNGYDPQQFANPDLGAGAAAKLLEQGKLDAAFFVSGSQSQLIQDLLSSPSLQLASMARAAAIAQRYKFLTKLTLPEGAMDLQHNIPPRDIDLIAPTANLVATGELHPAIISLLLQAAIQIHGEGGWFEAKGEFPSDNYQEYPLNEAAQRFYKNGPPFLQRYLPFWLASLIDRIKFMLLPLIVLLVPLIKVMPPLYRWRFNWKVYQWYDQLEILDDQLNRADTESRKRLLEELDQLARDVRNIRVPTSFSSKVYHLRQHIRLVQQEYDSPDRRTEGGDAAANPSLGA